MCHAYPKPESQFSSGKGFNECEQYSVLCYIQDIIFTSSDIQPGGHFSSSTRVSCDAERTFSELGRQPKWGVHWPLMFWAAVTSQTNSHLQKHLTVGLISVNFGCLKVRHPGRASPLVYFCSRQRDCFTCLGCLPCDGMNHSSLQSRHLYCWSYGRWILWSLTVSVSL